MPRAGSSSLLDRIIGHAAARRRLQREAAAGRPAHAYLLTGPAKVGKRALARAFAGTLLCQAEPIARPCGICAACHRLASDAHPDFRLIDRSFGLAERRARPPKNIPIEAIRALQHDASMSAHLSAFKVYIVAGAETLSLPAMDALLKTLEEPAPRVVIVLTAADVGRLPATIESRCRIVKLGLVPADEIADGLIAYEGVEPARARALAHLSGGLPGWAIAAARDPEVATERAKVLAELIELDTASIGQRLKVAEKIAADHAKNPEATSQRLEVLAGWWRDLLLVGQGLDDLAINQAHVPALRARAAGLPLAEAGAALRAIDETAQRLSENAQPRLTLELLTASLPRLAG